jgi:hypothetical protein
LLALTLPTMTLFLKTADAAILVVASFGQAREKAVSPHAVQVASGAGF